MSSADQRAFLAAVVAALHESSTAASAADSLGNLPCPPIVSRCEEWLLVDLLIKYALRGETLKCRVLHGVWGVPFTACGSIGSPPAIALLHAARARTLPLSEDAAEIVRAIVQVAAREDPVAFLQPLQVWLAAAAASPRTIEDVGNACYLVTAACTAVQEAWESAGPAAVRRLLPVSLAGLHGGGVEHAASPEDVAALRAQQARTWGRPLQRPGAAPPQPLDYSFQLWVRNETQARRARAAAALSSSLDPQQEALARCIVGITSTALVGMVTYAPRLVAGLEPASIREGWSFPPTAEALVTLPEVPPPEPAAQQAASSATSGSGSGAYTGEAHPREPTLSPTETPTLSPTTSSLLPHAQPLSAPAEAPVLVASSGGAAPSLAGQPLLPSARYSAYFVTPELPPVPHPVLASTASAGAATPPPRAGPPAAPPPPPARPPRRDVDQPMPGWPAMQLPPSLQASQEFLSEHFLMDPLGSGVAQHSPVNAVLPELRVSGAGDGGVRQGLTLPPPQPLVTLQTNARDFLIAILTALDMLPPPLLSAGAAMEDDGNGDGSAAPGHDLWSTWNLEGLPVTRSETPVAAEAAARAIITDAVMVGARHAWPPLLELAARYPEWLSPLYVTDVWDEVAFGGVTASASGRVMDVLDTVACLLDLGPAPTHPSSAAMVGLLTSLARPLPEQYNSACFGALLAAVINAVPAAETVGLDAGGHSVLGLEALAVGTPPEVTGFLITAAPVLSPTSLLAALKLIDYEGAALTERGPPQGDSQGRGQPPQGTQVSRGPLALPYTLLAAMHALQGAPDAIDALYDRLKTSVLEAAVSALISPDLAVSQQWHDANVKHGVGDAFQVACDFAGLRVAAAAWGAALWPELIAAASAAVGVSAAPTEAATAPAAAASPGAPVRYPPPSGTALGTAASRQQQQAAAAASSTIHLPEHPASSPSSLGSFSPHVGAVSPAHGFGSPYPALQFTLSPPQYAVPPTLPATLPEVTGGGRAGVRQAAVVETTESTAPVEPPVAPWEEAGTMVQSVASTAVTQVLHVRAGGTGIGGGGTLGATPGRQQQPPHPPVAAAVQGGGQVHGSVAATQPVELSLQPTQATVVSSQATVIMPEE